jgi:hypothetical protein
MRLTRGCARASCAEMDTLSQFGLAAVTAMLIFYAAEDRSAWYRRSRERARWDRSNRFLQGAWPFGLVEAIWAAVAVNRWRVRMRKA